MKRILFCSPSVNVRQQKLDHVQNMNIEKRIKIAFWRTAQRTSTHSVCTLRTISLYIMLLITPSVNTFTDIIINIIILPFLILLQIRWYHSVTEMRPDEYGIEQQVSVLLPGMYRYLLYTHYIFLTYLLVYLLQLHNSYLPIFIRALFLLIPYWHRNYDWFGDFKMCLFYG